MSHETESKKIGREPIALVECLLDKCLNRYNSAATNLLLQSDQFENASWVKTGVTVVSNVSGILTVRDDFTADKLTCDNTGDDTIYQDITVVSSSNKYFFSIYLKNVDCVQTLFVIEFFGGTYKNAYFVFVWSNYSITAISPDVTDYGAEYIANGWVRIWIATTNNGTGNTTVRARIDPEDSGSTAHSLYAWGAQLEQAAVLGHYVATTTASASRACAAALSPGNECYNTYETCQDIANYARALKEYRFCESRSNIPVPGNTGFGEIFIPCLKEPPDFTSTKLNPGKGISTRGAVTVKLQDFTYHDRTTDPYYSTRTYNAEMQGTYFGKLLARNKHFISRMLRVYAGFLTEPFNWANFEARTYLIDKFDGPDDLGNVTIQGKDILKLADNSSVQVPSAGQGKLTANITATATSFSCTSGKGSTYAASGTLKIGSELMTFTRVTDTFTVTRGTNGTTAATHNVDEVIQECLVYSSKNVVDILYELLVTYASVPASYIPYNNNPSSPDEWDNEKAAWLSTLSYSNIIHTPTGLNKLIDELCLVSMINVWWSDTESKIKLLAVMPPEANTPVTSLNDTSHFIEDSFKVTTDQSLRRSQIWLIYDKENKVEDNNSKNYRRIYIAADTNAESNNAYGTSQVETVISNWLTSSHDAQAAAFTGRMLSRFRDPPRTVEFKLDAKDHDVNVGDLIEVTSRDIQDFTGASVATRFEIIERREIKQGQVYQYKCLETNFYGKYAFIGPGTLGNYTAETEVNRQSYGFISSSSALMSNGDPAYKII